MIIAGAIVGIIARVWILPKVYAWAITRPNGPVFSRKLI